MAKNNKGNIASSGTQLPGFTPPYHADYIAETLEKKGNWRLWREKYLLAQKQIEYLERALKREQTAPTQMWKRIKAYLFGNISYYGKICTLGKWWHTDSGRRGRTIGIFGTWIQYIISARTTDSGKTKVIINFYIGKIGISYDNYDDLGGKAKRIKFIRKEDEAEGEECCSG